ncbi:gamma carbonic anhydrase family protein [Orbaceae bacterium ac157xtp]
MIYQLETFKPDTENASYIAKEATIIGRVKLAEGVTIWPGAVLRGDIADIIIGEGSNVQDNATLHIDYEIPCQLGKNVTVGHNAVVHSATIDDNVIIGMGSIILNNSHIAKNCIIGAGSVVTHKLPYEEGCLIMGSPAKIVRKLTDSEISQIQANADHYRHNGNKYNQQLKQID